MPGTAISPAHPRVWRTRLTVLTVALVALQLVLQTVAGSTASAAAGTPVTYQDQAYPAASGPPSADKPQSKLWYNDGAWWGLLRSPSGPITVHRLANHVWTNTGTVVDDRAASTGDALWTGSKLYVASRVSGGALRVIRMSYDAASDMYAMDAGFPKQVASNGSESVTIARDSAGKFWISYTQGSRVYVAHSTTSDTTWTAPFIIPTGDTTLSADDISAVIAFSGKIGVMYSDQQSGAMRFAVHVDGAADSAWTNETALSGAALADDHINLKSIAQDDAGRIYAATKTSRGDSGEPATDPLIYVLTRSSTGTWTQAVAGQVRDALTRPQLAIDTTNQMLYVVMASPDTGGGGIVYYKRSALGSTLSFPTGKGSPFVSWSGVKVNNPTTTKDPVDATTGLVVLATDDTNHRYYHGELSLGGTTTTSDTTAPTVPAGVTASATAPTSVTVSWTASTDNVGVTGYRVFRNGVQVGTPTGSSFTDATVAASTTYSYTVAAVDAANNASAQSTAASVTTQGTTTPPPTGGTVSFVSAATATGTTTSTAVASPAGLQAGDVLVAAVSARGAPTITAPAGWTQVRMDANGTTMRQAVFVKAVTGADGSSTWTLSSAQASVVQVLAYRGVNTTTPVIASAGTTSTTAAVSSPAVAAVNGARVVAVAGIARTGTLAPGSPLTERAEMTTAAAATYKLTADSADTLATGTTAGPYTTTANGSAGGVGQTVALRPAA
jgi:hypothetical protein